MIASTTEIFNMAIRHLGSGKTIASTTEQSTEAKVLRDFWATALEDVLGDAPWPFAKKFASLVKIGDEPTTEWTYSYRYPADCIKIQRIYFETSILWDSWDTTQINLPFIIVADPNVVGAKLLYCNWSDVSLQYTSNAAPVSMYPSGLVLALSYRLAYLAAPAITGGDANKLGDKARREYEFILASAKASAINEQQEPLFPESSLISERNSEDVCRTIRV